MQNNADIAAKQKGGTARTAIKRAFFMRTIAHIECQNKKTMVRFACCIKMLLLPDSFF